MKNKTSLRLSISILAAVIMFCFGFTGQAFAKDDDPHKTGLKLPTPAELEWQNKHMTRVKKVKLNRIGLERVNKARKEKGLRPLTEKEAGVVEKGKEIEGTVGDAPSGTSPDVGSVPVGLPDGVDNSTDPLTSKYFPPIRSQGSIGSCACFSSTYYTMTFMYAAIRDLDAKNGGDEYRFSPKWCYNMVNGGADNGSWFSDAYDIALKNGLATWAEFPYDADYREWCLDTSAWRNAIDRRFDHKGYVSGTNQDAGIETVKQMLNDGYLLNYATYVNSWNWTTISDDPATTSDDAYVGKPCAFWVNGNNGPHGMTVVGYNDNLWVDINGNGSVDSGEKGAFRIANSWGSWWKDGGFCWLAYDALKNPSAVSGGPSTNRQSAWWSNQAYWIAARAAYQPTLVAEFTLNHAKRNQLRMSLGISDISQTTPSTTWYPEMIYYQGGPYAFDGTTTAIDGTFVFDFTDIAPAGSALKRYYVGMYDSTSGDIATLKDFTLIDVFNGEVPVGVCSFLPLAGDHEQVYGYIDYDFNDGNERPVAVASATPLSGQAPLTVSFDGSASYDNDGSISSYSWNFGDGATGSGAAPTHTYTSAGNFTATLTVTDDRGATDQDTVAIEVLPDPTKIIHVTAMTGAVVSVPGGKAAQVTVLIENTAGPVSSATVQGSWSGLVKGGVSGVTGSDGKVTFTSRKTKKKGIITFEVTGVSKSGYSYDPGLNSPNPPRVSVDTNQQPYQPPAANAGPDQTVYDGDTVSFDGSGSTGSNLTYAWDFGDGSTGSGATPTHVYASTGTYTATLTVTDDHAATDSDTVVITVIEQGQSTDMYLSGLSMTVSKKGKNNQAKVTAAVTSDSGPVANATVTGQWSGLTTATATGLTDSNGNVTFSSKTKSTGTFTFTVTDITAAGYTYNAGKNLADPTVSGHTL